MSAFVWWGVVIAGLVGYPFVAGCVYRKLAERSRWALPDAPTGSHTVGGQKWAAASCSGAEDASRHGYLGPDHYCAACWKRGLALRQARRTVERANVLAWLWPVAWIALVPKWSFRVGADITATTSTNSLPEYDHTEARP